MEYTVFMMISMPIVPMAQWVLCLEPDYPTGLAYSGRNANLDPIKPSRGRLNIKMSS